MFHNWKWFLWLDTLFPPLQCLRLCEVKKISSESIKSSQCREKWKELKIYCHTLFSSPFNAWSRAKFSFFYLKWLILSFTQCERRIMRANLKMLRCLKPHETNKKYRNSESSAGNLLMRFNFSHITPWCFTAAVHWFLSSGFSFCYSVVVVFLHNFMLHWNLMNTHMISFVVMVMARLKKFQVNF